MIQYSNDSNSALYEIEEQYVSCQCRYRILAVEFWCFNTT